MSKTISENFWNTGCAEAAPGAQVEREMAAAPALDLRLKRKLSAFWPKTPLVAENLIFLLSPFIKLKLFSTPNSTQIIPKPQQPLTHKNTFKSPFFQHQTHTKIIIFI